MAKLFITIVTALFLANTVYAQEAELAPLPVKKTKPETWAVYYGNALPPEQFLPYDVVVFDGLNHPALRPLQNRDKTLLGYLSIGEAETYRNDFQKIKDMGVLLQENKNWPGHFYVDIRDPRWVKYLVEVKIPDILYQRFDGIMLDTLDSPLYLEEINPSQYAGMKDAAINLLREIRLQYPTIKIMLNRGFSALPEAATEIDMLLLESTLTDAVTNPKKPKLHPKSVYQEAVDLIKKSQEGAPNLKVYALDYWNIADKAGVRKAYEIHRQNGFVPYITTPDLQSVVGEPK